MSKLKFEVTFIHLATGAQRSVVVDLIELSGREIGDALRGPGGLFGPVAWAYAYCHAAKRMGANYMGRPESVKAHRVQ
jgi:hypothetical protein